MLIFKDKQSISEFLQDKTSQTSPIGFVPTMGALHEGHIALVKKCISENELTVCSIFVNPTQFNDAEDLAKYPRPIEEDIRMLTQADCSVLFLPSNEEMYPENEAPQQYELGFLDTILEGKYRNGHFQGVAQIVDKLLQVIKPNNLYFGQKDYQQCLVIKELIHQKKYDLKLHLVPTLREEDGLAMSSRNRRLTEAQRAISSLIYQCLVSIQSKQNLQHFPIVQKECFDILSKKGLTTDYIEIADAATLEILKDYTHDRKMVALIATKVGNTRLIDNVLL